MKGMSLLEKSPERLPISLNMDLYDSFVVHDAKKLSELFIAEQYISYTFCHPYHKRNHYRVSGLHVFAAFCQSR